MHIVRYAQGSTTGVGTADGDGVRALPGLTTMAQALHLPLADLRERCEEAAAGPVVDGAALLAPVDGRTDVWAAGVTYTVSKTARMEESERAASVYELVYDAERPELFFKAVAWRVVTDGEPIAIRADSAVDVPEPELALVVNAHGETVGYLVCDDVSSRTIEGDNPLYLPQAKAYLGACALSAGVRPVWELPDPYALGISLTIRRGGRAAWQGTASTSGLHRRLDDLVAWLLRADVFPDGVVLATGTSLVPPLPFTLEAGDEVAIEVDEVGTLTNPVVRGVDGVRFLAERPG
ncbi:MAG TPA: fumarylacetoacetate hydrolase family protein [Kineosporiaceae bacterium]|nr:fumarylacetoacetate hydrolase family protein [Kineosporiaceae bacterium]